MRNSTQINKKGVENTSWLVTLPFEVDGIDAKKCEYDSKSCLDIVRDLDEHGCFQNLAVNVTMSRRCIEGETAKGYITIGNIVSFNKDTSLTIMLTGKGFDYVEFIKTLVIKPRVVAASRGDHIVKRILGFEAQDFYNTKSSN